MFLLRLAGFCGHLARWRWKYCETRETLEFWRRCFKIYVGKPIRCSYDRVSFLALFERFIDGVGPLANALGRVCGVIGKIDIRDGHGP